MMDLQPLLVKRKITDTCGVHNLHGMPAVMGGLLSVLLASVATPRKYDQFNSGDLKSLHEIFPASEDVDWSRNHQAWLQFAAMLVTMAFALVGGGLTGERPDWRLISRGKMLQGLSSSSSGNIR